jgi:hypothetical protein
MKQFADDSLKFDENSRKFSKWVENTVGKGEIAHHDQFLLFPVFSNLVSYGRQKVSLCGNGLKQCYWQHFLSLHKFRNIFIGFHVLPFLSIFMTIF